MTQRFKIIATVPTGSSNQFLQWNSAAAAAIWTDSSGSGGGASFAFTDIKTSNYTATSGDRVQYDPVSGSLTGSLFVLSAPSSPTTDNIWAVKNVSSSINLIEINGNGNLIEDPISEKLTASFNLQGGWVSIEWQFNGTSWLVT